MGGPRVVKKGLVPLTKIKVEKITMGHVVPPDPPEVFGNNCGFCAAGKTPENVTVIFENTIACTGCQAHGSIGLQQQLNVGIINGIHWHVPQWPTNPCLWRADFDGDFGDATCYAVNDCTGCTNDGIYFKIRIQVLRFQVGGNEAVWVRCWPFINIESSVECPLCSIFGSLQFFDGTGIVKSDCVRIENISNTVVNCTRNPGRLGKASVYEGLI